MAAKAWIKLKVGLARDPKHRRTMGEGIWLYLYLVDHADWDTGVVDEFKDKDCAGDMEVSISWVRRHRRALEEATYIDTAPRGPKGLRVTITKWIDPRSEGVQKQTPLENKGAQIQTPLQSESAQKRTSLLESVQTRTPLESKGDHKGVQDRSPLQAQHEHASRESVTTAATSSREGTDRGVFGLLETVWGQMVSGQTEMEMWQNLEQEFPLAWIEDAMKEALEHGGGTKKSIRYIRVILNRWKAEGREARQKQSSEGYQPAPGPIVTRLYDPADLVPLPEGA